MRVLKGVSCYGGSCWGYVVAVQIVSVAHKAHRLVRPSPRLRLPELKHISAETLP